MPRTYVDNEYNRRAGRVGLPVGSAVISSKNSGSSSYSYNSGASRQTYNSGSSSGTYVDNAFNRRAGRVGLPLGSAVIPSNSSNFYRNSSQAIGYSPSPSVRTYTDNAFNRNVGRVGLPVGSAVISKGQTSIPNFSSVVPSGSSSPVRTYVDNNFNRTVGRVGMPVGSAVISRGAQKAILGGMNTQSSPKTYVDNAYNRSLGRVGLPHGSAVVSSSNRWSTSNNASSYNAAKLNEIYGDNDMNRELGCVGEPLGSMVVRSNSNRAHVPGVDLSDVERYYGSDRHVPEIRSPDSNDSTDLHKKVFQHLLKSPEENYDQKPKDVSKEQLSSVIEAVLQRVTRDMKAEKCKDESKLEKKPKIEKTIIEEVTSNEVQYEDIEFQSEIGHGGFGDVHKAKYQGSVIAVKKLRIQRVSRKTRQSFVNEVQILCKLDHPNVVKFIGACVVTPNLCICMEHMKLSLYEALYEQELDFSKTQKVKLSSNISSGLQYLHSREVAHCDVKCQNVLLDYEADSMDETLTAKLTDFGLSTLKNNSESVSTGSEHRLRGTPRYCAPEVLRGEMMSLAKWKYADVYSLSLVIYEIFCNEEPFEGLSVVQLMKHVGSQGATPAMDESFDVSETLKDLLTRCWSRDVSERPTAEGIKSLFASKKKLFKTV